MTPWMSQTIEIALSLNRVHWHRSLVVTTANFIAVIVLLLKWTAAAASVALLFLSSFYIIQCWTCLRHAVTYVLYYVSRSASLALSRDEWSCLQHTCSRWRTYTPVSRVTSVVCLYCTSSSMHVILISNFGLSVLLSVCHMPVLLCRNGSTCRCSRVFSPTKFPQSGR